MTNDISFDSFSSFLLNRGKLLSRWQNLQASPEIHFEVFEQIITRCFFMNKPSWWKHLISVPYVSQFDILMFFLSLLRSTSADTGIHPSFIVDRT